MYNRAAFNKTAFNRSSAIVFEWLATANAETDTTAAVKIIRYLNGSVEAIAAASGVVIRVVLPSGISAHTHTVKAHTHTVKDHTHTVQDHTHKIEFGIYEGARASSATIRVDGKEIPTQTSYSDINIVEYLKTDSSGKIQRSTWHTVEILPDTMSRIVAAVFMQTFCNSRGGGDY